MSKNSGELETIEEVYKNQNQLIRLSTDIKCKGKKSLYFYNSPNKNKSRTCIARKLVKVNIFNGDCKQLLDCLGFKYVFTNRFTGFWYEFDTIRINIFQVKEKWFAKIFTEGLDIKENEKKLQHFIGYFKE